MSRSLTFVVEDEAVQAALAETGARLSTLIDLVAEETALEAAVEGGARARSLGEPWEVKGAGESVREVIAPVWWAHFLAHGTRAHGPRSAQKLHFFVGDDEVFADFVSGITADPFDERAAERVQSKLGRIIESMVP